MRTQPVIRYESLLIGGDWRPARSGATFDRRDPYDGSLVATYADAGLGDVADAIEAARRAFDHGPWRTASSVTRKRVLDSAAQQLAADAVEFTDILTREVGQPRQHEFVLGAAESLEYFASLAADRRDEAVTSHTNDALGLILREPVGVVGALPAWNSPLSIAHKVLPALAVGCSIVVKPAHHSPGVVLRLARILQDCGLPDGVLNVVTSQVDDGALVGNAIVTSPLVDMVTFTGSTATGSRVGAAASAGLKRVVLELGGKSPNVVFADAPSIDDAVRGAISGIVFMGGQACQAGSRLLVERSIHDEFLDRVEAGLATVAMGDPFDADVEMGPLVSSDHLRRVEKLVASAEASAIRFGGHRPTGPQFGVGNFFAPTLITAEHADTRLVREEVFGPVLVATKFDGFDEAVRLANDSAYGLASAVWTSDVGKALGFSRQMRAGTVWVNTYRGSGLRHMPTGGFKASGLGREHGHEGLDSFLEVKTVHIRH